MLAVVAQELFMLYFGIHPASAQHLLSNSDPAVGRGVSGEEQQLDQTWESSGSREKKEKFEQHFVPMCIQIW